MSENRLCSGKLEKLSNLMHSIDFNHLCAPMLIPGEGNARLCLALVLMAVLGWSWSSNILWGLYADLCFFTDCWLLGLLSRLCQNLTLLQGAELVFQI